MLGCVVSFVWFGVIIWYGGEFMGLGVRVLNLLIFFFWVSASMRGFVSCVCLSNRVFSWSIALSNGVGRFGLGCFGGD